MGQVSTIKVGQVSTFCHSHDMYYPQPLAGDRYNCEYLHHMGFSLVYLACSVIWKFLYHLITFSSYSILFSAQIEDSPQPLPEVASTAQLKAVSAVSQLTVASSPVRSAPAQSSYALERRVPKHDHHHRPVEPTVQVNYPLKTV